MGIICFPIVFRLTVWRLSSTILHFDLKHKTFFHLVFSKPSISMNQLAEVFKDETYLLTMCSPEVFVDSLFYLPAKGERPVKPLLFLLPGLLLSTVLIFRRGRAAYFSFSNSAFVWTGQKLTPPFFWGIRLVIHNCWWQFWYPFVCLQSVVPHILVAKIPWDIQNTTFADEALQTLFSSPIEILLRKIHQFKIYIGLLGFSKIMTGFYITWGKLRLQIGVKEWKKCP